ncbi:MAG: hypothetical protein EOP45_05355 [Sphingobacteriaceae bacterium]|nr:MAG: hypothetical protein EOP45_05355 [Sphingobacteriaceae bacterium]
MSVVYASQSYATGDTVANNSPIGYKNRIINGGMRIDQRNAGVVTSQVNAGGTYALDRFNFYNGLANATKTQQVILGTTSGAPPKMTGLSSSPNAILWTNSATASASTSSIVQIQHTIEGNRVVDFNWWTSGPRTVTLSFWVYASVAGNYCVSLSNVNSTASTSYVAPYIVTPASTWQQIVLTIPGPTIGTWATDNSSGIFISWILHGSGSSSNVTSTPKTWQTASSSFNYVLTSTQTNLGNTASSTFALTSVQLELGTIATPLEWRPWEIELTMCQRYYEKSYDYSVSVGTVTNNGVKGVTALSAQQLSGFSWQIEKRSIPSAGIWASTVANSPNNVTTIGNTTVFVAYCNSPSTKSVLWLTNSSGLTTGTYYVLHYVISADF